MKKSKNWQILTAFCLAIIFFIVTACAFFPRWKLVKWEFAENHSQERCNIDNPCAILGEDGKVETVVICSGEMCMYMSLDYYYKYFDNIKEKNEEKEKEIEI
jgi:hypothetical protein